MDVPGCAGSVLGHDYDETGQGQYGPLLVLRHALVDGVVLGDDLGDHQFAERWNKNWSLSLREAHDLLSTCWEGCEIPAVHLDPPVEVHLLAVLQPADARRRHPLGLAHEASCACSGTGLALGSFHDRWWHCGRDFRKSR